MATIYRRPRSPYWICIYLAADGRWKKTSTKIHALPQPGEEIRSGVKKTAIHKKTEAMAWCTALQDAENVIGLGSPSEVKLRSIIDAAMVKVTGKDVSVPIVREWFGLWLEGKSGANAENTVKKYRQYVKEWLDWLGPRADSRLETITQRDILDFRNAQRDLGKSPSTINLTIAKIIAAPFRLAFNQGLIKHHPVAGLPKLEDRGKRRKHAFSTDQVKSLLSVAEGDWEGAILCGYTTGMRLGDVVNLQEESIDQIVGVISFHQQKTQSVDDEATVIGLHPDFAAWLAARKNPPKKGPVFPTLAGRPSSGRSGLSMAFGRIMAKAGIVSEKIRKANDGDGRNVNALSFHSFRHGAASAVFNSKIVEQAQKSVTGHARGDQVKGYTHIDIEAIKAASSMIPRLGA